jgi:uncharacterized SAM-binding protein YcdF (DUF218 family)
MELGAIKPILASLALPPLSLLLLALLGMLLTRKHKRAGMTLIALALALLWVLSCNGAAVWLAQNALPRYPPASAARLQDNNIQAIVILGGGVLPQAPEYGLAQPGASTAARLRYGIWLSRQTGLPLAFTGGIGHGAGATQYSTEAEVAARVAQQEYGVTIRWLESASRDTAENARLLAPMLKRDGIQRIALVTQASHMPRAMIAFERAGLSVQAAPTGYTLPRRSATLEWLPSASGLQASQEVLHEWLGIQAGRWLSV